MGILWTLLIGFLAGVIAKFLHPGPNEPSGFIVTTLLGVAGAFVATYLGQAIGWYGPAKGHGSSARWARDADVAAPCPSGESRCLVGFSVRAPRRGL